MKALPDSASLLKDEPKLLEWSPASWGKAADAIREPPWRKGRLLPNLLKRYRQFLGFDLSDAGRIAAFGFSAGSNSGLRELLRNPEDRARIDFVGAVDGLHPNLVPGAVGKPIDYTDPRSAFADWNAEMEPFAAYAERAARFECVMIGTASEVVPLGKSNAKTAVALEALIADVATRVPNHDPWIVPGFPTDRSEPRPGERHPVPVRGDGLGNFVCFWYSGSTKRAHELQAHSVVPDLFGDYLVPSWTDGSVAPAGWTVPGTQPGGGRAPGSGPVVSSSFWPIVGFALGGAVAVALS